MFFRVLFFTLLLGSTAIVQLGRTASPLSASMLFLYGLIGAIFLLSFSYSLLLNRIRRLLLFAYAQIGIDTLAVTLIIFLTGSFSSVFSFLYLLVIIYASILLYRRGSMVMAALSSIQYGILIDLEYYGLIRPLGEGAWTVPLSDFTGSNILLKIIAMMTACFGVAFLSGLLSEQTRQSKEELKAMEEHVRRVEKMAAIGEMAAGLAHEIKNPLASLRGSIQMLEESIADPDDQKLMGIILREADRLGALVSDFLLFARPPAGRREVFNLSHALAETISLFQRDRRFHSIRMESDLTPEVWVEMDPTHLRQILWNLLLNAAEAIEDHGRITIEVFTERPDHAVLQLSDTGCGIPPDVLKSIFDPFFTTKARGTGLGLSVVHRIIESYDCWINVKSEVNQGTTFILNLKRAAPPT